MNVLLRFAGFYNNFRLCAVYEPPEKEKKTVFVICAQKSPRKFGKYFRVKIEKNYPGVLIFSGVWCII